MVTSSALDECVDDAVLRFILPDGKPHPWEGSLWETSGRSNSKEKVATQDALVELVRDVAAFHNAYGGYILAGVDQYADEPIAGCTDLDGEGFTVEKLNEQVYSYTRTKIVCKFRKIVIHPNKILGLLLVPMRRPGAAVVRMAHGSRRSRSHRKRVRKGSLSGAKGKGQGRGGDSNYSCIMES
jgi:predicted HTH transcriptional regulator